MNFFFLLEVIGKHGHSRRVQLIEVAVEYVKAVIAHFGSNYGIGIHSISRVVELLNMMAVSMTIMLMRRGVGQGRRSSRIGMLMVMVIHGFRSSSIGLFDCRPPFFLFSLLRFSASYYWSRVGVGWGSLDLLNGRGPSQLVFPVSFWTFNFTDGELYENEKNGFFFLICDWRHSIFVLLLDDFSQPKSPNCYLFAKYAICTQQHFFSDLLPKPWRPRLVGSPFVENWIIWRIHKVSWNFGTHTDFNIGYWPETRHDLKVVHH